MDSTEATLIAITAILAEIPGTASVDAFKAKRHADFVLGSRATRENSDKIASTVDYIIRLAKSVQTKGS